MTKKCFKIFRKNRQFSRFTTWLFQKIFFFEVTNFFENFFEENWGVYDRCFKESGMCYYTASYLKSQFCRPGGVFWPFLDPREAKKGKKKGKQTNSWQKKLPSKKTYECWLLCRKKNHGCTIITHRATFVYFCRFFVSPHGKT